MQRLATSIAISFLLAIGFADAAYAQKPELIVEVGKQEIYEGESVLYRVTLNHVEEPKPPTLEGFDKFQITTLSEQSLDSRQITIINGQRSEVVRRGRQYNYRLTPKVAGTLIIPAPIATVDGTELTGRAFQLTVVPPEKQDIAIVEFTTDRSAVYPMQPFTLSLNVAVKGLPSDAKNRDPLTVQQQAPALSVPWLSDDQLPDGFKADKDWREVLEPLMSRRGNGFQINNIGSSSVFSFFEDRATGFHPTPQKTKRQDANGDEVEYWEYQFARTLVPQKLGDYQFGPITLKGTFGSGVQDGQLIGKKIFAVARPLTVTVKDVPIEGRPDSYIGAVGTFDVHAQLAPTSAQVGDPMTLTITVSGQGTLADARPPQIASLDGVGDQFRTYEATEESKSRSRRFTFSLRPLSEQVREFPAIPISYFDVESEKYVTVNTDPIPLTICAAETLSNEDIVSAPATATNDVGLEQSEGGVFANDTNLKSLRNEAVHPVKWGSAWAGLIAVWAIASTLANRFRRIREDPAMLRRRSAASRAKATLDEAQKLIASNQSTEACESLRQALAGLIADYANVAEAGVTPRDAAEHLKALGLDESSQQRSQQLLESFDAAKYGAVGDDVANLEQQATELIDELLAAFKSFKSNNSMIGAAIIIPLVFSISGCGSGPDLETSRRFQAAEQAFAAAKTAEDFERVAQQYQQVGNEQFKSGTLFYNQGNAWMRAGKSGRAIAAYRQALRFRPRDPYLSANLQNALRATGQKTPITDNLGTVGYLFFWQNWLSYPEKFIATTLALMATLSLRLLAQTTSFRTGLSRTSIATAVIFVLFAGSAIWDWQRFENTTNGVVSDRTVVARKGNSESYEPAFTDPLSEGKEFVVIEQRENWLNAQFEDAGTAWLPLRAVELY